MRVILIGASGLFGSALLGAAEECCVDVVKVSRGAKDEPFLHCDLGRFESIAPALVQINDLNGEDIAFINSGILGPVGLVDEIDADDFINTININALSNIYIFKTLHTRGVRRFVVTSSGAANRNYSGWFSYCQSKSLQKSLWTAFCYDYPEISVKFVAPGVLQSDMHNFTNFVERGKYPDLDKFYQIKESGAYQSAEFSARKIFNMLCRDDFFTEGFDFIDLRNF
jgi:NADP-dependent 3-hydroxy acid dehydrogenase YdfG